MLRADYFANVGFLVQNLALGAVAVILIKRRVQSRKSGQRSHWVGVANAGTAVLLIDLVLSAGVWYVRTVDSAFAPRVMPPETLLIIAFVLGFAAIVVSMLAVCVFLIRRAFQPRRVGDLPHCRHCDYLLIGINPDRCPECGAPFDIVYGERTRGQAVAFVGGALLLLLGGVLILGLVSLKTASRVGEPKSFQAVQPISNLKLALDAFQVDCGRFPTNLEGLNALVAAPPGVPNWAGPYIDVVPFDPWGRPYIYRYPGSKGKNYDLISCGQSGVVGNNDNITN